MISGEEIVRHIMQAMMLVDGGVMPVPLYVPIISTIIHIQFTLMGQDHSLPFIEMKKSDQKTVNFDMIS